MGCAPGGICPPILDVHPATHPARTPLKRPPTPGKRGSGGVSTGGERRGERPGTGGICPPTLTPRAHPRVGPLISADPLGGAGVSGVSGVSGPP